MRRTVLSLGVVAVVLSTCTVASRADPEIDRRIATLRGVTPRPQARPAASGRACTRASGRRSGDPARIDRAVRDASLRFGVDPRLIRSVIRVESAGDPGAVSPVGARGLMQIMPRTARALGVDCAFDPRENVIGGTRYLRQLRDRMGSWKRAIAAYHAGPRRVREGRIPAETRRYVKRVLRFWRGG